MSILAFIVGFAIGFKFRDQILAKFQKFAASVFVKKE